MKESSTYEILKKNLDNKIFSRTGIISATKNPILKGKRPIKLKLQRKYLDLNQKNIEGTELTTKSKSRIEKDSLNRKNI